MQEQIDISTLSSNQKCEFSNRKTNKTCPNDVIPNTKYCEKHKRYGFNKRNKEKSNDTVVVKDNDDMMIGDFLFNDLDRDIEINECLNKNNSFIKDLSKEINIDPKPVENIENIELTNESLHDPVLMSEILCDLLIASSDAIEKLSKSTRHRTGFQFNGLSVDTIRKKEEYKKLFKHAYIENSEKIDSLVTPTTAIFAHFGSSMAATLDIQKKNEES